jgi:hypothetical protein
VTYYLDLKTMVGADATIEIPSLRQEKSSSAKFAVEQFYQLPEGLTGYTAKRIEVYEAGGTTPVLTTNDPVVYLKSTQNNAEIRVYVGVADDYLAEQKKNVSFNNQERKGTDADVLPDLPGLLPQPPAISGVTTQTTYLYNEEATLPKSAGVYAVRIQQIITIGGTPYIFWDSNDQADGRPIVVLYIDRLDIILKSNTVDNAFLATEDNRVFVAKWNEEHTKPSEQLVIEEDGTVDSTTIDTSETTNWDDVKKWIDVMFTADAFRRSKSNGPEDYTANTFEYFLKGGVDESSINVYKVTGKLYLWASEDAYKQYVNGE